MSVNTNGREVAVLAEISRIVGNTLDLRTIFDQTMRVLASRLAIERGRMVLLNDVGDELRIAVAYGLTPEQQSRGRYALGEGITGKVVLTGEARIVPNVKVEPDFLNRTGTGSHHETIYSFVCLPITLEGRIVGALSVDIPFIDDDTLQANCRLLEIVTAILGQALAINRLVMREKKELIDELDALRQTVLDRYKLDNVIGESPSMLEVFKLVRQVASTRATVLIMGETGTGKEMIAKAIHFNSDRRNGPFVRVNCGALAGTLLESELFGHVKGAFTGAIRDKIGRFEAADGGTLFLDEIGTLETPLQVKLLRVLQEREFERVGDTRTISVDVRIIAATNLDLEKRVRDGTFREDLFYRLNVVSFTLPPLRERREDIPRLIDFFLDKYNAQNNRNLRRISRDLLTALLRYPWPGNVRELENAIERAVVMSTGEDFTENLLPLGIVTFIQQGRHRASTETVADLAQRLVRQAVRDHEIEGSEQLVWDTVVTRIERTLIAEALKHTGGVKTKAADFLGINRNTLNKKFNELGLAHDPQATANGT